MATNDFLPFAHAVGANVVDQATYAALTAILNNGFSTGIANSQQLNKVWRQSSIMSAVLAQFVVDLTGADATDDGTTATLLANLKTAITSSQAMVRGTFKNLAASANGISANVAVTADEIALENASNLYRIVRAVSVTINTAASGANGLDTGSLAASTWYSVWVIFNPTTSTTAGLISLSATAPTLPSGYTFSARVGWIRTDGTASKYPLNFRQKGRKFHYVVAAGSNIPNNTTPGNQLAFSTGSASPPWTAVSVSNLVPPTASLVTVACKLQQSSGTSMQVQISENSDYSNIWNGVPYDHTVLLGANTTHDLIHLFLESTNIYWKVAGDASGNATLFVHGWEDNL